MRTNATYNSNNAPDQLDFLPSWKQNHYQLKTDRQKITGMLKNLCNDVIPKNTTVIVIGTSDPEQ